MITGAIITTIVMCLVFIGAMAFSVSRMGKGGKWED
ncbi:hypothetical protein ES703_74826 [subsurface metagenome]